ncbi:hypothetical protein FNF28_07243 [Cafeteria roenbergensis]|uniref:MRH domain-containing protein n=1 Tax=Cafeteria roenbergensis TaxID=33653 RepID=A0A5A8CD14_CAFRO|nr:hypothetical protein FNF28_07243 [Cafeteria roenbergensis]
MAALAASQCTQSFPNATFDLSKLRVPHGTYTVRDNRGNQNATVDPQNPSYDSYIYMFNVCDNVEPDAFPAGPSWSTCETTTGAGRGFGKTTLSTPSAAFQYLYLAGKNGAAPYAECHRLSADVASHPGNETWSLVEPGNPSRGVQVRYEGGDLCCANGMSACSDPQPRSLELQFFCKDDTANVFDRETVLEYGKCHYKIWLDTASGCPTQCPIVSGHLCSGHGVCDFDTTSKQPRCFCNEGFQGNSCSDPVVVQSGLSAAGMVLIFVSIFLVFFLVVLYYLWRKIRSLRLDPNAYKSLHRRPEARWRAIYDD